VLGAIVWCSMVVTVGYLVGDELYPAARDGASNFAMGWRRRVCAAATDFDLLVEGPAPCSVEAAP